MKSGNLIKSMDFCWVISDKKLKGSGLSKGDLVMVSGTRVVPATKKDPYLQRVLVVTLKIEDEKIQIPSEKNDYKAYLIDPRNLSKVDEDTHKWAETILKNQYPQQL